MPRGRPRKRLFQDEPARVETQSGSGVSPGAPLLDGCSKKEAVSDDEEFVDIEVDDRPSTSRCVGNVLVDTIPTDLPQIKRLSCLSSNGRGRKSIRSTAGIPRLTSESEPVSRLVKLNASSSNKNLVSGITSMRTRGAAMHERMVNEMSVKSEPVDDEVEWNAEESSTSNNCDICHDVQLYSKIELLEHRRAYHKDQLTVDGVVTGTLFCAHPHCSGSFPDVAHLIAHLVAYHNQQQYRIRKVTFNQIEKFEEWQKDLEKSSRSVFLSAKDPEGDVTEECVVQMYCEFCDDWRQQAEKGPPNAQQVPQKLVGCPAHFTAHLNYKKNKVVVIGCLAHLGHCKKPSWSAIPCDAKIKQDPDDVGQIKCDQCEMVCRTRAALTRHRRLAHPESVADLPRRRRSVHPEPKLPSLECGDPECDVLCDSMITLVQHVAQTHNREDLVVEEYRFNTMDDFESWKVRMEQDTCAKFTKVSGRDLKSEATKYYLCHLSGHVHRNKKRMAEMPCVRNRPTKKLGRYCTAFMSLKYNKDDDSVSIKCCLGHFGHSFDVRRLPVPETIRTEIAELLKKGHSEEDIVHLIRSRCSENERGYWLQRYEVRNMALKLQRQGVLIRNVYSALQEEEERAWEESMNDYIEARESTYAYAPDHMNGIAMMPSSSRHTNMQIASDRTEFKPFKTLLDIHSNRRHQPFEGNRIRYIDRIGRMPPMNKVHSSVDLVEYVDEDDYGEDGEVMEMREYDELLEDNGEMYYAEEEYVGEEKVVQLPQHSNQEVRLNVSSRKRVPILKEPPITGNSDFDELMLRIKDRIDKIQQQLKVTQDVAVAQNLLKELKGLEARIVTQGVGQTTVPFNEIVEERWEDEYFEDGYEVQIEEVVQSVSHEEEIDVAGTDDDDVQMEYLPEGTYIQYLQDEDDVMNDLTVEAEEVVQ